MRLRFVTPAVVGTGETVVELDGTDFANVVRGLSFDARPGDVATVKLDVLLREGLTFEGDLRGIEVPDESAELLRRIGWLPPLTAVGRPLASAARERLVALHREYEEILETGAVRVAEVSS